jgi:sugar phosphate isomerase/epimerase
MKIGVQLYTLRDLCSNDFAATVREVKSIGYAGVELAGHGNLKSAKDVRKACDDAGLIIGGSHAGIDALERDAGKVMDDFDIYGCTQIVVPWLDQKRRADAAGWRKFAADMMAVSKKLAARGFTLGYHNHSFEFEKFDGQYGLDILWQHSDAKAVRAELDVYWVKHGKVDPAAYMKQLGTRLLCLHLKDMDKSDPNKFTQVGRGQLDFASIITAAKEMKLEWGFVEQDNCYDVPPMESVRVSFEALKTLGAV